MPCPWRFDTLTFPCAACRAAIIAALLLDPGDEKKRDEYCRRIENITRWKSENGPDLQFFRDEIRKAFGGRAPKVLDMFAGGGASGLKPCAWAVT